MQSCPTCGQTELTTSGHCAGCGSQRRSAAPVVRSWPRRGSAPLLIGSVSGLLLIALVATLVFWFGRDHDEQPTPLATADTSGTTVPETEDREAIDDCLIGTWQTITHMERIEVPEVDGKVEVQLTTPGELVEFRSDGTGSIDFGQLTQLSGDLVGFPYAIEVTGMVPFQYGAESGTMVVDEITDSEALVTVVYLGNSADGTYVSDPGVYRYDCAGDQLSMSAEDYVATLERIRSDS